MSYYRNYRHNRSNRPLRESINTHNIHRGLREGELRYDRADRYTKLIKTELMPIVKRYFRNLRGTNIDKFDVNVTPYTNDRGIAVCIYAYNSDLQDVTGVGDGENLIDLYGQIDEWCESKLGDGAYDFDTYDEDGASSTIDYADAVKGYEHEYLEIGFMLYNDKYKTYEGYRSRRPIRENRRYTRRYSHRLNEDENRAYAFEPAESIDRRYARLVEEELIPIVTGCLREMNVSRDLTRDIYSGIEDSDSHSVNIVIMTSSGYGYNFPERDKLEYLERKVKNWCRKQVSKNDDDKYSKSEVYVFPYCYDDSSDMCDTALKISITFSD